MHFTHGCIRLISNGTQVSLNRLWLQCVSTKQYNTGFFDRANPQGAWHWHTPPQTLHLLSYTLIVCHLEFEQSEVESASASHPADWPPEIFFQPSCVR